MPPIQQFTPFESSPILGVNAGMAGHFHASGDMFMTLSASITIGAEGTPSQQFPPFVAPLMPVADIHGFDAPFPSSSQLPPYEYVSMTADSSSPVALHPVFSFLSGAGGTFSSLKLPDYYSLG